MLRFNTPTPEVPRHRTVLRSALVTDYEEDEKTVGHHTDLTLALNFTSILMAYISVFQLRGGLEFLVIEQKIKNYQYIF